MGYPRGRSFGDLLRWHLEDWGTRSDGNRKTPSAPWSDAEIAFEVHQDEVEPESAVRNIQNWKAGGPISAQYPARVERLFASLFGKNPDLACWKEDLRIALKARRNSKMRRRRSSEAPTVFSSSIPRPTTNFIGRSDDVEHWSQALTSDTPPAILFQGAPGVGKTELARAVAHHDRVIASFGDRRWLVPLAEETTAAGMSQAISRAVGTALDGGLAAALKSLAEERSLVLLDGLEAPWEPVNERQGVEGMLAELARVPGIALLGSFRGRDRMKEPGWERYTVEPLRPATAKELFQRIAGRGTLDDPRLDDIIEDLGGVPLAVHLLAHRASGRTSLAQLWREWQDRGVDILTLSEEPPGPLSSFSHSIVQSLDSTRTTPDAHRLFSMLGQLPDSILEEHVTSIIGAGALDAADSLLRVGLIVENSGRIELLPPVKDYARRKSSISEEDETLLRDHYLRLIAKLGLEAGTPDDSDNVERIEADIPNIEWAFLNALADGKARNVGEALRGLSRFISLSSRHIRIFKELDYEKRLKFNNDIFSWAYVNVVTGDLSLRNGDLELAGSAYHRASMFLSAGKFPKFEAEALTKGAEVDRLKGKYESAKESIGKSREIYRELDDYDNRPSEAYCFIVRARIDLELGEYEESSQNFGWAAVYSNDHDIFVRTLGCKGMGDVKLAEGDHDFGRGLIEEALVPFRGMGCRLWEARCVESLGRVDLREGKYDSAQSKFEDALTIYRQIGDAAGQADAMLGLDEVGRLGAIPVGPAATDE